MRDQDYAERDESLERFRAANIVWDRFGDESWTPVRTNGCDVKMIKVGPEEGEEQDG